MAEQAGEFFGNWQALARESWDAWLRKAQSPAAAGAPFGSSPAAGADDVFARSMTGLKAYMEWMQGAAAGAVPQASSPDWSQSMRQMFEGALGGGGQPFAHAFTGTGPAAAGTAPPWQAMWQAANPGMPGVEPVAAFGHTREQQLQQQALFAAMIEYLEAQARYQTLIQRAHAQGMERMQEKLAQQAAGAPVESMKAMYDLWVDAAEDAYAEVALSDEFREAFGAMSNAQMRLRRLQQQQTEQWCREQGMPTRSEVASLGQRLQEVRRELRAGRSEKAGASDGATVALQAEIAALKRRLDALEGKRKPAGAPVAAKSPKTTKVASGKRKAVPAKPVTRAAVSRKSKK